MWLVKAQNGTIHDNIIRENRHRIDTLGGSSGITFEGEVFNFKIYGNDVIYNDVYGMYFVNSSDNEIYDNEIHHNGDGAIGWDDIFYWNELYYYLDEKITGTTAIHNNYIHHNRRTVFEILGDLSENFAGGIIVENNILEKNGGNSIHYEDYEDYDTTVHPEDWKYDGESVILLVRHEELRELFEEMFEIGTNTIDGEEVTGIPEEEEEPEKTVPPPEKEEEKETTAEPEPLPETDESDNKVYFVVLVIICIVIAVMLFYVEKRSKSF